MDIRYICYDYADRYSITMNELFFYIACEEGHKEWLQWACHFDHNLSLKMKENLPLQLACESNNLDVVKYIVESTNIFSFNDVDFLYNVLKMCYYELAIYLYDKLPHLYSYLSNYDLQCVCFLWCMKNRTMTMWLYNTFPQIPITLNNHEIFREICSRNDVILADFFATRRPQNYFVVIDGDEIVQYDIQSTLTITKFIKYADVNPDICCICYDKMSNVYTSCKHYYCLQCLEMHYIYNGKNCPYCRKKNSESELCTIL